MTLFPYNPRLQIAARSLRKCMTDTENLLWSRVRRKQLLDAQFYRQKTIGNYIVDFYAPKAKLVVEIDGSQHLEVEHLLDDRARDAYLRRQGLTVLRFDNLQVLKETEAVVEAIYLAVAAAQIPPNPPLLKGGNTGGSSSERMTGGSSGGKDKTPPPNPPSPKNRRKNPPLKKGGRGDLSGGKNRGESVS